MYALCIIMIVLFRKFSDFFVAHSTACISAREPGSESSTIYVVALFPCYRLV